MGVEKGSFVRQTIIHSIAFYQRYLSPWMGCGCRFYPSCSRYAEAAIREFGVVRGLWRGFTRLMKCHPFHPGGIDELRT